VHPASLHGATYASGYGIARRREEKEVQGRVEVVAWCQEADPPKNSRIEFWRYLAEASALMRAVHVSAAGCQQARVQARFQLYKSTMKYMAKTGFKLV
jgi:hypothetical protein